MSDWKNVQYKDGKMRTSSGGGGGGASALTDLDDVNVSSPSDGQVLKYDDATSKWVNANESGGGHTYSTTEQVVGTWINGKPLYEKTIDTGSIPSNTTKQIAHNITNIAKIVDYRGMALDTNGSDARAMPYMGFNNWSITLYVTPTNVCIQTQQNWGNDFPQSYVTIQYTKTTD